MFHAILNARKGKDLGLTLTHFCIGMLKCIPSEGVTLQCLWDLTAARVPCMFPFLLSLKDQLEEQPKGHDLWLAFF